MSGNCHSLDTKVDIGPVTSTLPIHGDASDKYRFHHRRPRRRGVLRHQRRLESTGNLGGRYTPIAPGETRTLDAHADTDADGCADGNELSGDPSLDGGLRDPSNYWDFFDVTGDNFIDLSDTLDVLPTSALSVASPSTPGDKRDRSVPDAMAPWRTAESDDGVDRTDAINNLASFGDDCTGSP